MHCTKLKPLMRQKSQKCGNSPWIGPKTALSISLFSERKVEDGNLKWRQKCEKYSYFSRKKWFAFTCMTICFFHENMYVWKKKVMQVSILCRLKMELFILTFQPPSSLSILTSNYNKAQIVRAPITRKVWTVSVYFLTTRLRVKGTRPERVATDWA